MNDVALGGPELHLSICRNCNGDCKKAGKSGERQRLKCKTCGKYQQSIYQYRACNSHIDRFIVRLNRECCGIRSISRLLGISKTTVITRIKKLADSISKPLIFKEKSYEVDELRTYIKKKSRECWVCLALERSTGQVVDISVGRRTKKTLGKVVDTLTLSEAKKVYTDGLDIYKSLLPTQQHVVRPYHHYP
jgi:insertion element IS1 protein InsB